MWYVTIAIEILTIIKEKKSIIEREREKDRESASQGETDISSESESMVGGMRRRNFESASI